MTGLRPDEAPLSQYRPPSGPQEDGAGETTYVTLKRIDSIGLEEMNKTFPNEFRREIIAELALGIRLSPLLDLSFGKVQKFERTEHTPWEARDDGWRIKLQKNF